MDTDAPIIVYPDDPLMHALAQFIIDVDADKAAALSVAAQSEDVA